MAKEEHHHHSTADSHDEDAAIAEHENQKIIAHDVENTDFKDPFAELGLGLKVYRKFMRLITTLFGVISLFLALPILYLYS